MQLTVTVVTVAHWLSTHRPCRKIYLIEAGRGVADCSFDEPMEQNSLFRRYAEFLDPSGGSSRSPLRLMLVRDNLFSAEAIPPKGGVLLNPHQLVFLAVIGIGVGVRSLGSVGNDTFRTRDTVDTGSSLVWSKSAW